MKWLRNVLGGLLVLVLGLRLAAWAVAPLLAPLLVLFVIVLVLLFIVEGAVRR